jgi:AcrR family transcriptional regulator
MAITDTKQKILDASLQLFNENGINNVRLQQIADATGISVGNLAYHFNNKEAITESLIANVITSLQELVKQYGKYHSFNDLDFFFKEFYKLCTVYRFFNFDILEIKRNFPTLYELLQPLFNKVKLQLERRFELWLQQRLLLKESNIKNIASNTWLLMFFLPAEAQVNGKSTNSENLYRRRLWDYLMPYFTAKGSSEFSTTIESAFTGK